MSTLDSSKLGYSEQDAADKLILPYLHSTHKFPSQDTLDYQAQHTLEIGLGKSGRYDGLFLSGGYPYVVLEAKKYSHELTDDDESRHAIMQQAPSSTNQCHFSRERSAYA